MENLEQEEDFESQYNSAELQLKRIMELVSIAHSSYLEGELKKYSYCLQRIFMELGTYMTKEQIEEGFKILKNNPKFKTPKEIVWEDCEGNQDWDDKRKARENIIRGRIAKKLIAYENYLRKIMNGLGFLGIQKTD